MCINRIWKCLYSQQSKFKLLYTSASDRWFDWTDNSHTPKLQRTYQLAELKMYHLRVLTLSFTKRKWHIYECSVRRFPPSGGLGRGWPKWLGRVLKPFTATSCYHAVYTVRWIIFCLLQLSVCRFHDFTILQFYDLTISLFYLLTFLPLDYSLICFFFC